METLLLYLIKSGGLLAAFFLTYYILLRNETFFNVNRWFLLTGLVVSTLLPLYVIEREVQHTRTPIPIQPGLTVEDLMAMAGEPAVAAAAAPMPGTAEVAFEWAQLLPWTYLLVALLLLLHTASNLYSLYRLLRRRQVVKRDGHKMVDLDEDIAPFSFFRYIVFNSSLYDEKELESILSHESVHSRERHSFDVLFVRLFCIAFWFNPFVWLYRKAVAQNLEYIADRKAARSVTDRRAYQIALLKVVGQQQCLTLTNPFYQSLIKKRIVMLNTHPSQKRNLWKYAFVLPLLAAFMMAFQVKLIAKDAPAAKTQRTDHPVTVVIDKNTSDSEIKEKTSVLKAEHGITLKVSKVKRNKSGEITGIKVEYKDKDGHKGTSQVNGTEPISPIRFYKSGDRMGFGNGGRHVYVNGDAVVSGDHLEFIDVPEAPDAPEPMMFEFDMPDIDIPDMPEIPEFVFNTEGDSIRTYSWSDTKPLVIVNGKVVEDGLKDIDPMDIVKVEVLKDENTVKVYGADAKDGVVVVTTDKLEGEAKRKALTDSEDARKKVRIELDRVRDRAKAVRADRIKMRNRSDRSARAYLYEATSPESKAAIEEARKEMAKAKEEMQKARAEMEKAKAELEKAKAELNKK